MKALSFEEAPAGRFGELREANFMDEREARVPPIGAVAPHTRTRSPPSFAAWRKPPDLDPCYHTGLCVLAASKVAARLASHT